MKILLMQIVFNAIVNGAILMLGYYLFKDVMKDA